MAIDEGLNSLFFMDLKNKCGYPGHFSGYRTFLGHYFTSVSSKIVIHLNRIFVVREAGEPLESGNRLYGSDGMS